VSVVFFQLSKHMNRITAKIIVREIYCTRTACIGLREVYEGLVRGQSKRIGSEESSVFWDVLLSTSPITHVNGSIREEDCTLQSE